MIKINTLLRVYALTIVFVSTFSTSYGQCVSTQAYTGTNSVSNQNYTGRLGLSFTATEDLIVDSLGAYDAGLDGFIAGTTIEVGIVKVSDGSLVGSTLTFANTEGDLKNMFRIKPLSTQINLEKDTAYILVAVGFNANDGNHNSILGGGTVVGTNDGSGLLVFGNYYYDPSMTFGGTFSNNFATPSGVFHSATMTFGIEPTIEAPISVSPNSMISCEDSIDPYALQQSTNRGLPPLVTGCFETINLVDLETNANVIDGFDLGEQITISSLTISYTEDTIIHPLGRCDQLGRKYLVRRYWLVTDVNGNTNSAQQNITITDNIAPTLVTNSPDLYLDTSCEVTFSADTLVNAATDDNCSAFDAMFPPSVNVDSTGMMRILNSGLDSVKMLTLTKADFNFTTCPASLQIELFVTDECENVAIDTVIVMVRDTIAPMITDTPDSLVLMGCSELAIDMAQPAAPYSDTIYTIDEATFNGLGGAVNDNCDFKITYQDIKVTNATNPIVVVTRIYTLRDSCENSVDSIQIIEINDTDDPIIVGPITISPPSMVSCETNLDPFSLQNMTGRGLPTLVTDCADTIKLADLMTNAAVMDGFELGEMIMINNLTLSYTQDTIVHPLGRCDALGRKFLIRRFWTASDDSGNTITTQHNITITDNIAPTLVTNSLDLYLDASCEVTFSADTLVNSATDDNCSAFDAMFPPSVNVDSTGMMRILNSGLDSVKMLTLTKADFNFTTCPASLQIELFVTDECENVAIDTVIVMVRDTIAPMITTCVANSAYEGCNETDIGAPDLAFSATVVTITEAQFSTLGGVTSDECGIMSVTYVDSLDQSIATCNGTNPMVRVIRTYTVTDSCTNNITCVQAIDINDIENPTFTCPIDITVNTSDDGVGNCGTVVNGLVLTNVNDNCSAIANLLVTYIISGTTLGAGSNDASGNDFNLGLSTIEYFVRDCQGNLDSCDFTITVVDDEAPMIDCSMSFSMNNDPDRCSSVVCYAVEAEDNCMPVQPTSIPGLNFMGSFGNSTYFSTGFGGALLWEDANTMAAELGGHLVSINSEAEQNFIEANIGVGRYWIGLRYSPSLDTFKWTSGEDLTYTNWFGGQPGNSPLHGDYVFELDTNGGILNGWHNGQSLIPARYIIEFEGPRLELIDGLASGSSFPVGITPVTYRAVDAAGNADTCMLDVIVLDVQAPVITCPTVPVTQLAPFDCVAEITFAEPTATDNCSATVSQIDMTGLSSGSDFPIGITELIYAATDTSGNADTCSIFIEVLEFQVAEMQCIDINLSLDAMCEGSITTEMALGATEIGCPDSCKITITTIGGSIERPNLFTNLDLKKTFEYTIECGGNSCWATVSIEDYILPTIACTSDTISCFEDVNIAAVKPVASDNCHAVPVLINPPVYTETPCDNELLGYYDIEWSAKDDYGNVSAVNCKQKVSVRRADVKAITKPISSLKLECNTFPTLANGAPTPARGGVPKLGLMPLYPMVSGELCNTIIKFEDEVLFESLCKTMIQRTWNSIEWHCDSIIRRVLVVQVFEIADTKGPEFVTQLKDVTVSAERFCEGSVNLPDVTLSDACNGVKELYVSTGAGVFNYTAVGNGVFTANGTVKLKEGTHELIFFAKDDCDNPSQDTMIVTVRDLLPPIAVCETYTTVSLTNDGEAWLSATAIDDGSFDDCSSTVTLEIARMPDNATDIICYPDHVNWTDEVAFCCFDASRTALPMVALRVTDNGGNSSICMVEVEVQNIEQFNGVVCPSDMIIECDFVYDSTNLVTAFGPVEVPGLTCPSNIDLDDRIVSESLDECRIGSIFRTIDVKFGGNTVATCNQTISVVTDNPIDGSTIQWPKDVVITNVCPDVASDPNFMDADAARPIVTDGGCNLVGMEMSDKIYQIAGNGACYKIVRTWSVIDWCGRHQNTADTIPTWSREQIIEIRNTIAPVITSPTDTVRVLSYTPDCTPVPIKLTASATDSCTLTEELQWTWIITFEDGSTQLGVGSDASGTYRIGTHSIEFTVRDRCGNVSQTGYVFEVINAKTPTPYCKYGLSTALVAMDLDTLIPGVDAEMSMLTPSYFDNGSYHVCGYDVILSFSSDIDSTLLVLSCGDIGRQDVELWVTDPVTGNQAHCKTFIEVIDSNDVDICTQRLSNISGRVATADDRSILESEVYLMDNETVIEITDKEGQYNFGDMPLGGDYMVEPHKDGDDMNGVSTLDLVLIQRHILGISKFTDPYTMIAADINHDDKVTASDLVGLRKLVLGVTNEFEDNTSWRFVDKDHKFPVANDPWAEYIKEDYEISLLNEDMSIDFIGVKIGDVNGNVTPNLRDKGTENRGGSTMVLSLDNQSVTIGQEVRVNIASTHSVDLKGLQAAFDINGLGLINIESGSIEINETNTYYNEAGILNISYNNTNREVIPSATNLFTLVLSATKAGELKDMITIDSDRIDAEAYVSETMEVEKLELEWRNSIKDTYSFTVGQNEPNPWMNSTVIDVLVPIDGTIFIHVKDITGKLLYRQQKEVMKGNHQVTLTKEDIPQAGIFLYEVEFNNQVISKKMISVE